MKFRCRWRSKIEKMLEMDLVNLGEREREIEEAILMLRGEVMCVCVSERERERAGWRGC